MTCHHCHKSFGEIAGYTVSHLDNQYYFCSRICLVEFIAPEVNSAVVVKQWVPTEDEVERMIQ